MTTKSDLQAALDLIQDLLHAVEIFRHRPGSDSDWEAEWKQAREIEDAAHDFLATVERPVDPIDSSNMANSEMVASIVKAKELYEKMPREQWKLAAKGFRFNAEGGE